MEAAGTSAASASGDLGSSTALDAPFEVLMRSVLCNERWPLAQACQTLIPPPSSFENAYAAG